MAANDDSHALQKGSDSLVDCCCSVCEDTLTEAQFYCECCSKWFCDQCVSLHALMYRKHTTLGKGGIEKWPVAKGVADLLVQCEEHKGKQIEMFCEDHSQLCCSTCLLLDHRQCNQITQIASEVDKKQYEDLHKLTADITDLKQRLRELIKQREFNIKSLQDAYDNILEEIALVRQKFNAALDLLEKSTINEGKDLLNRLQESLHTDVDSSKNALKRIQSLQEAANKIGRNDTELYIIAFRKIQKELSLSDSLVRKSAFNSDMTLSFIPNKEIEKCLATVTTIGNIVSNNSKTVTTIGNIVSNNSKIITLAEKEQYNVKLNGELECSIRCISENSNGTILLADSVNYKVKILDKEYRVISHCDTATCPVYVCQISDIKVAVAVVGKVNEIHFLDLTNDSLTRKEKFNLSHPCTGICHFNGQLYVTSRTALYQYTLTGILQEKLYEDTSGTSTVYRCAVNGCGDRIYVVNFTHNKVLTLNLSGQVLASYTDPELQRPIDVHVTESGHVLVCGFTSNNIIQLNSDGAEKMATVVSRMEGANFVSICCSRRTGSILVGRLGTDNIVVFNTK